jgi:transposase
VTVTAGQAHESRHFEDAIGSVRSNRRKPIWIAGDKGYSYPRIRVWCARRDIFDVIPLRSNQSKRYGHHGLNKLVYRGRNVVERTIGHLKENRRIGTRFEKLAIAFLGMLKLAFMRRYLAIIDPSDRA